MPSSESVLLLAYYHPRYVEPLEAWGERLRVAGCRVAVRSHATWYVHDVLEALSIPRSLVCYFGHGVPGAWRGFATVDAAALRAVESPAPHRLVASLCCDAFAADGGSSVAEALLDGGLATTVVGHEGTVRYEQNRDTLDRLLGAYLAGVESSTDPVERVSTRARSLPTVATAGGRPRRHD